MLRVFIQHVVDPKNVGAEVATRMINGKKSFGAITKDAPDPLPRGVFKVTLSTALPAVLKVNAVTSSDEDRRDFIKEEAIQYAGFCVELLNLDLEHQCSKGEDLKISAQPILAGLKKSFNEYMKGILNLLCGQRSFR